jgi:AAA family ATP:ADP antiporter
MTNQEEHSGAPPPPAKSIVGRMLSPIADVRAGEERSVLLMTLIMLLVLGAYYMLKTAREVFILTEGGAAVKSYSSAGQAILLLCLVPAYGAVASRLDRTRLVLGVTLFFASHVVLFALAQRAGVHIGIVYFLWVGIFNVMVIAQFWALAADLFTPEQGKRLFPLIGVGSSLGAWLGSVRAGQLMETMGPLRLLSGGGGILVVCALLAVVVSRRRDTPGPREAIAADAPMGKTGGFTLIFNDRYLMLIAALTVLLNVVNTSGEYLFGRYVVEQANAIYGLGAEAAAARQQYVGNLYSRLFSTVNLLGLLLQLFVVSRVFKFLGVGKSLFVHPIVALTGYLLMLRAPSVQLMGLVKVADNSLDYSLGNTTKQALWLNTSRESKYKAKQAVDSFFVRAGDVLQAGIVFGGERLALAVPSFAALNIALTALWLGVVAMLNVSLARKQALEPPVASAALSTPAPGRRARIVP